ncbi:DUF1569 domain-containing protein [Flagellimonas nanhaiensis]|uniref:DUF1569 domain-containing protein n=1 Tax=Flagellimonas nanhaiensis TaxID=2292706 RepID=UPI0011C05ED6|nr:DUF1569 domain-containing protein [Allomuricauda nanhaiensis]
MTQISKDNSTFLDEQFLQIADFIPLRDQQNAKVSAGDVAWHLDHSLKTINRIYEVLKSSNPKEYKRSFSFSRVFVFTSGIIPRGVARAPKSVRPPEIILTENLHLQLEQARENLKKFGELKDKAHFKHPYFKVLDKTQSIRFLKIHTRHHLKIVRDILK